MTCAKFSLLSRNFPKLCAIALLFASFPARAGDMTSTLLMGTSRIDVVIDSGDLKVSQADLMRWVQRAAEAVSTYYGRYPVPHAGIRIIPVDGNGIRHGQTFPYNGGFIKIRVGAETLVPELDGDWMLTTRWCILHSRRWKTITTGWKRESRYTSNLSHASRRADDRSADVVGPGARYAQGRPAP